MSNNKESGCYDNPLIKVYGEDNYILKDSIWFDRVTANHIFEFPKRYRVKPLSKISNNIRNFGRHIYYHSDNSYYDSLSCNTEYIGIILNKHDISSGFDNSELTEVKYYNNELP